MANGIRNQLRDSSMSAIHNQEFSAASLAISPEMQRTAIMCACVVAFAYSSNYTNHAPLAPALAREFGFSQTLAGLLTTGIFATHATMQIPGGHLVDRFGARRVLLVALLWVAFGNFGMALATAYWQLLACKIFTGVGTGVCFGLGEAASLFPADHRHEIFFTRLPFELVQNRTHRRPKNIDVARGQRSRARNFAPNNNLGHHAEPEAAEFLRNVVKPQPERLGLAAQPLRQLLLHLDVVDNFAFQRDQFAVDEAANVILQKPKLLRKLEIHCSNFPLSQRCGLLA